MTACIAALGTARLQAQAVTFEAPKQISAGATSSQMAIHPLAGDFNGDGKTDYLVEVFDPAHGNSYLRVLMGNGNGGFSILSVTDRPVLVDNFFVADVNGDGKDDIVTLHGDCDGLVPSCQNPGVSAFTVYLSDGNGHFTVSDVLPLPVGYATGVLGDFNKDGKIDVAVSPCPQDLVYDAPVQQLFTNKGGGAFVASSFVAIPQSSACTFGIAAGDFNGDGDSDLAVFTYATNSNDTLIYTLLGHGDGSFAAPKLAYSVDSEAFSMLASDLNRDGKTDLIVSLDPKTVNNQFVPGAQYRVASLLSKANGDLYWDSAVYAPYPLAIDLSDLNGDGKQDLVDFGLAVASESGNAYLGLGGGKFGSRTSLDISPSGGQFGGVAAAPLARGKRQSLMISNNRPTLELLVNTTK